MALPIHIPFAAPIAAVCKEYFGVIQRGGKWSPPNRCDSCPLRTPCLAYGGKQHHNDEERREHRAVFEREAFAVLGAVAP